MLQRFIIHFFFINSREYYFKDLSERYLIISESYNNDFFLYLRIFFIDFNYKIWKSMDTI